MYWIRKLQARVLAGDHAAAIVAAAEAERLLWMTPAIFERADYHFYAALALIALCETASAGEYAEHREAVAAHHSQLRAWAEHCAGNFAGPAALLATWREGLAAIALVHARDAYLSQAFDRNLVRCPDGTIGYIDFEDDPGETLPVAECQARDWLSYLHSTAMLVDAASPHAAATHWHATLADASDEVRQRLAVAARRMRWLRNLPSGRRWGRDTQRVRAVASLLARWYGNEGPSRK